MLELKVHELDTILQLYIQYQLHYFQGEFNSSKNTKEKLGGAVNDKFNDEIKWYLCI